MRRPIVSKSERSGTGVDMANLSKAVCHGESDKCRFGNPPQESNFQRLGISLANCVISILLEVLRSTKDTRPWPPIALIGSSHFRTLMETIGAIALKPTR